MNDNLIYAPLEPPSAVELLRQIKDDPVLFVKMFLRADPEEWQIKFLTNVATTNRVAVKSSPGVGKTCALSWIILWLMLTHSKEDPCKIIVTAPAAPQLDTALLPELAHWHGELPKLFRDLIELRSDKAFLARAPHEVFMHARTASKDRVEAVQGIHAARGLVCILIDEASGMPEMVMDSLLQSLSGENSKVIMCRNPRKKEGYFYNAFTKNSAMWALQTISAFDSKYSSSGNLIEEVRNVYGETSMEWRIKILANFPSSSDDTVIPLYLIEAAVDRDIARNPEQPIIWGLDVASFGSARTALSKRQGNVLLEPVEFWTGRDVLQTAYHVQMLYNSTPELYRPFEICVDCAGIGAGTYERLRELGLPVTGVHAAENPAMRETYARMRDELWFRCRHWFESYMVRIPREGADVLAAELAAPHFYFNDRGQIRVESKEHMRQGGFRRSPDLADSLCLTFYHIETAGNPRWQAPIKLNVDWVI